MADARKVYVGEIGKRIKVKVGLSLANLSVAAIYVEKPDGTVAVSWVAYRLGNEVDGIIYHDTVTGDLSVAGLYRIYAKLVFSDGRTFYGEPTFFDVFNPSEG